MWYEWVYEAVKDKRFWIVLGIALCLTALLKEAKTVIEVHPEAATQEKSIKVYYARPAVAVLTSSPSYSLSDLYYEPYHAIGE